MKINDIVAKIAEKEDLTRRQSYIHQLFKQLHNKPAPIYTYTYRERIQIAYPYISFVFLDIDSKPMAKNIQLSQPYSYIPIRHIKLSQREPHILYEGSLYPNARCEEPAFRSFAFDARFCVIENARPTAEQPVSLASAVDPNAQRKKPVFRSFAFDARSCVIENALPTAEQPASLASTVDPNAQHEEPALRSFAFDAQSSVIENARPTAEQPASLASTFDPNAQREEPAFRSFAFDAQSSFIENALPTTKQYISSDATRNYKIQDKEVLTNSYMFEDQFGQCIQKIVDEAQECDSYHISLSKTELCCYDHNILRHETRCKILRFHRYRRINHIGYLKTKPAT